MKASEDYISPDLAEFLRCIDKTLRQVFPEVVTIPGDSVHFFAAARGGSLTNDSQELIARLRVRHIRTSYVREYYLPYRMMPDRLLDLESQIRPDAQTRINRDFTPIAYYFDVALWSTRFNTAYRRVFQTMAAVRFGPIATSLALALFGLVALLRWLPAAKNRSRASAGFCVAAMGFTLIGLEMLLLLAFQAIYGYVYQQLAIIIAGFMLGMTLGSRWGLHAAAPATGLRDARRLFSLQLLAALSPVLLYVLFDALAAIKNPATVFLASQILFPCAGGFVRLVRGISISRRDANLLFKLTLRGKRARNAVCPGSGGRLRRSGCPQLVSRSCFWLPGNGLAYGCGESGAGGPGRPVGFGKTGRSGVTGSGALRSLKTIAENAKMSVASSCQAWRVSPAFRPNSSR